MICLKCRGEMQKTIFDGALVDYCPECRGFFLDSGEFEEALKNEKPDIQNLWKKSKNEIREDLRKAIPETGVCPKCLIGHMRQEIKDKIKVDSCDHCDGIFFDKGELEFCITQERHGWIDRIFQHIKDLW